MDEIESIQSIQKNNEETYWLALLYNEEYIDFFIWLQGWLLFVLSIVQIRFIRSWFNKKGYKENMNTRGGKWLFKTVRQGMSDIGKKFGRQNDARNGVDEYQNVTVNGGGNRGSNTGGKYRI